MKKLLTLLLFLFSWFSYSQVLEDITLKNTKENNVELYKKLKSWTCVFSIDVEKPTSISEENKIWETVFNREKYKINWIYAKDTIKLTVIRY